MEANLFIILQIFLQTSHAENSKLFVNMFAHALQNIWWIRNTIASILCENMLVYYNLEINCSSKLTSFLILNLFRSMNFSLNVLWKYPFLDIISASKAKKEIMTKFRSHSQFPHFIFPFTIPAFNNILCKLLLLNNSDYLFISQYWKLCNLVGEPLCKSLLQWSEYLQPRSVLISNI